MKKLITVLLLCLTSIGYADDSKIIKVTLTEYPNGYHVSGVSKRIPTDSGNYCLIKKDDSNLTIPCAFVNLTTTLTDKQKKDVERLTNYKLD